MKKVRFLRGYRGWATDEVYHPCSAEVELSSSAAGYLLEKGWVEEIGKPVDYQDMEYRELQELCKEKGLKASGSTEDLIERLKND